MKTLRRMSFPLALMSALPWASGCWGTTGENLSDKAAGSEKIQNANAEVAEAAAKARADEARATKGRINVEPRRDEAP